MLQQQQVQQQIQQQQQPQPQGPPPAVLLPPSQPKASTGQFGMSLPQLGPLGMVPVPTPLSDEGDDSRAAAGDSSDGDSGSSA